MSDDLVYTSRFGGTEETDRAAGMIINKTKLEAGLASLNADLNHTRRDMQRLREERDAAVAILREVVDGVGDWYEQEPGDQTRGWCPDLSIYLRGTAATILQVSPEIKAKLDALAAGGEVSEVHAIRLAAKEPKEHE